MRRLAARCFLAKRYVFIVVRPPLWNLKCIDGGAAETLVKFQGNMVILKSRRYKIWIWNLVQNTTNIMQIFSLLDIWNGWRNEHISRHDSYRRFGKRYFFLYSTTPFTCRTEIITKMARFMGSTWGPPGSCGPRWVPCWPHEGANPQVSVQFQTRAPFQHPIRHLIVRSRKPRSCEICMLKLSDRSGIWQAHWQYCWRCARQISQWCGNLN